MGQVNIRVSDEKVESVRARLKTTADSLGISQGELLDRALESLTGGAEADTRVDEILELVRSLPSAEDVGDVLRFVVGEMKAERAQQQPAAGSIAGVQTGAANLPKNAKCGHCGGRFAGSRFATLCPTCEQDGHRGNVRDCDECVLRQGGA